MNELILSSKYINILQAIGNVQETVEKAIRSYVMEKIGERIAMLQREILIFQTRYVLSYEKFYIALATDEDFVQNLRKSHSTWERDFNAWEYCIEELSEWRTYNGNRLNKSTMD